MTAAFVVLAVLAVAQPAGQTSRQSRFTVATRPLSASVQGTFVTQGQEIELLVLWRGAAGWFFAPEHSTGGGSLSTYRGTMEYGPIRLDWSYDRARRVVGIGETELALTAGQNVVLVDNVGEAASPAPRAMTADLRVDSPNPVMATILGRSPEIVAFLRCDVSGPDPRVQARLNGLVCDDVKLR